MNYQKLFGKLLGYPECCITQFLEETGFGRRSVAGFCPCDEHAKVEDLSQVIGRDPEQEPKEFEDFLQTEMEYDDGLKSYEGNTEFFIKCWGAFDVRNGND